MQARLPRVHHRGDGYRAKVHRERDREVAALRHDGDAAVAAPAAVLVRPERCAVEVVDETVAVGPQDRHVAGRLDQRRLQGRALLPRFAEARGVADGAPRPAGGECPHHVDRAVAAHADEGGVRRFGQVRDRAEAGQPGHLAPRRVHRVDGAREVHAPALLDDAGRFAPAHRADRAGLEETREVGGHGRSRMVTGGDSGQERAEER